MLRQHWPVLVVLALSGLWVWTRIRPAGPEERHQHQPGLHGGVLASLGADRFHVETVHEEELLTLYLFGQTESERIEVACSTLTAYVRPEAHSRAVQVSLRPLPQPGDAAGRTSRFVGELPGEVAAGPLGVTIPSVRIGAERFRVAVSLPGREPGRRGASASVLPRR